MGSAAARDPGPPPLPVDEQLVALLGSVVVALEIAVEAEGVVEVEAEGVDDGRGEVLERPATREVDVAIEPTVELPRGAVGALRPFLTNFGGAVRPPHYNPGRQVAWIERPRQSCPIL